MRAELEVREKRAAGDRNEEETARTRLRAELDRLRRRAEEEEKKGRQQQRDAAAAAAAAAKSGEWMTCYWRTEDGSVCPAERNYLAPDRTSSAWHESTLLELLTYLNMYIWS